MYFFGRKSQAELSTCDPRLQRLADFVIQIKDHSVLKGHRGEQEQNEAYQNGYSKLQWPDGKHNKSPSVAMDIRTWPNPPEPVYDSHPDQMSERELRQEVKRLRKALADQPLREEQLYLLGIYKGVAAARGIRLRVGCDWNGDGAVADNSFDDFFHVELD